MSTPTSRVDPATIATSLKEAIVDGIINLTHAQVSGAGVAGTALYGARPRAILNSCFLLPQKDAEGEDEVTSPIWISSHGLQLQLLTGGAGLVTVLPTLSVYVRVLPASEDLHRPNCRASFILRPGVVAELKAERDKRLDAEWELIKGAYTSRRRHPEWPKIQARVLNDVYTERGIPRELGSAAAETEQESEIDASEEGLITPAITASAAPVIRDEDFEPLSIPHKWRRIDLSLPALVLDMTLGPEALIVSASLHALEMNAAIASQLGDWARSDDPLVGGRAWGYRTKMRVPPSKYREWAKFLEFARASGAEIAIPKIELAWELQVSKDWLDESRTNVFIALENRSGTPAQHQDETEEAIFLVSLAVDFPKALHKPLKLERIDPSYRYNRYLVYPAMGHNGGVSVVEAAEGTVAVQTTWAPRYLQPRSVPTESGEVIRGMRALSLPDSLDKLEPIVSAMDRWLAGLTSAVNIAEGLDDTDLEAIAREKAAFADDLLKWKHEREAISVGLSLLRESREAWSKRGPQVTQKAALYEAWLAMNEAMANFMQRKSGHDRNEWRLFQLAFIISNISSLASRMPEFKERYSELRDDSVTLLYFATGGGKSEAFFGLLVFNLFFDRLRGKLVGVTALLRYPLRLLTIQQAQRCARVLAQAELVRRDHRYSGSPFSIGFWVGGGGSPNHHSAKGVKSIPDVASSPPTPHAEERLAETDQKYSAALRAWRKLSKCPFCDGPTALRLFHDHGDQTLAHVCTSLPCPSNGGSWHPLPFYIVDEDIYDLAPSVLLGTVDKLALIGHSAKTIRRVYGMLGAAPWQRANGRLYIPSTKDLREGPEAKGMSGLFPAYEAGARYFYDPFPSLIIQDEAHLLDESLGTFAGLFESTLDAVFSHLSEALSELVATDPAGKRRRAKVIAASATVSDPQRQLEHLYQRSIPATQFPHPGPTLYGSFYAEPQKAASSEVGRQQLADVELASRQGRIYTAFMTNGKPHTATSVAVLAGFHLTITTLFDDIVSGDPQRVITAREAIKDYLSRGPLERFHRRALDEASASDIATVVDLHRIALTYVTNKKGGDQIMAAEQEETRKKHLNASVQLDGIDTRLITGSVDQGEIQAVVDAAQLRVAPGSEFPSIRESLRSVIATSAISHGVDVDEFNSMFFAGMPSDIAEYIQASSRVGRAHIGFVVLVPTPQRRRDRHIIQIFDVFHRFLERMVQPAAIDRWADKAVERVFPSIFQAYLAGVVPSKRLIEADEDKKDQVPDFSFIPNILSEHRKRGDAFVNEINGFIELAVGIRDGFAPEGEEHYRQKIDERTRLFLNTWRSPVWGSGPLSGYFDSQILPMNKPMTSLRDVDQGGRIFMSSKDINGIKQSAPDVLRVMELVRQGVSESEGGGE